MMIVCYNPDLS